MKKTWWFITSFFSFQRRTFSVCILWWHPHFVMKMINYITIFSLLVFQFSNLVIWCREFFFTCLQGMSPLLSTTQAMYVRNLSLVYILFYKLFYRSSSKSLDVLRSTLFKKTVLYILILKKRSITIFTVRPFEYLSLFIIANGNKNTSLLLQLYSYNELLH